VTISVTKYKGSLTTLGEFIRSGLTQLAEPVVDSQPLAVLSPVPVYACRKRVSKKPIDMQVRQTGWRTVVMNRTKPIAVLDLPKNERRPPVSIRGRNSAEAFFGVLKKADRIAKSDSTPHQVRFVVFHPLFVTALWLSGRKSLFIPTRIDSGKRPKPKEYSESQFLKLLQSRDREMHRHLEMPLAASKTVVRRRQSKRPKRRPSKL
jgi:hypothetical protein